jgi:SAM-dependent methyltransferase
VLMAAFDTLAGSYDDVFTTTRLGRWLRARVWNIVSSVCSPGMRVFEVGCGTGEDAIWLAQCGLTVVATDASDCMLRRAEAKARQAGVAHRIQFAQMDAGRIDLTGVYDAALADFGVLNCVADRRAFGRALGERLRPSARLVAVVMGPVCLWEIAWHLAHGEPRRALCRWRSGQSAHVRGSDVLVWYPSPRRLALELSPTFEPRRVVGLATLLPPSYLFHLVDRWPRTFRLLAHLDGAVPFGAWMAEHYVAVFERTSGTPGM